ncbi:hypothetical protein CKO09_06910 [Chromatium weissei]|nr:hypothetical protein [Chromatium weissei]
MPQKTGDLTRLHTTQSISISVPVKFILILTVVLQFLLLAQTFPLSELFSSASLLYIDNPFHEYNVAMGAATASIGYDSLFAAGKATGFAINHSDRLPAFLAHILPSNVTAAGIWKFYTFTAALIASICLPLTLIILRFERNAIAVSALLGLLLWWTGMFRWFHTAGMVSFVFVAFASIPFIALLVRLFTWDVTKKLAAVLSFGLISAILFFTHPLFFLPVTVFTIFYVLTNREYICWKTSLIFLSATLLIVVTLNYSWLYYFINPPDIQETFDHYQRATGGDLIIRSIFGIWEKANGAKINMPIILAAILGVYLSNTKTKKLLLAFLGTGIFWLLYAYTAGDNETLGRLTQPNRFAPVAYLFFALPAAVGIVEIFSKVLQSEKTQQQIAYRVAASLIAFGLVISVVEMGREVSSADIGHYAQHPPQVKNQSAYANHILNFLNTHTDISARVLFETSLGRIHDGGHIAGLLALKSQREFIGGPYVQTGFASFWDGKLFAKSIADISPETMQEYFDRYNIGWIIVHSEKSKRYFDQLVGVTCIDEWEKLKFYQVQRPHSFFIKGFGELVERTADRLVFKNVSGDSVILKYHYLPKMESNEGTISPIFIGDDPNPFIQLQGKLSEIVITYH